MHHEKSRLLALALGISLAAGCGPSEDVPAPESLEEPGRIQAELTVNQQRARCDAIKSTTALKGITNPLVYAAVAYQETGLAHCWSEATWACQGPYSSSCGGPVIAGSGDGACSLQQGGLGMYQLDSGTYTDTINTHGSRVLELGGNIDIGTNFIIYKVRHCPNTPNFNNDAEVIAWINSATPGTANYDTFMGAMAWCYNGCAPSYTSCNHYTIKQKYKDGATYLLNTFGNDYWYGSTPPPSGQNDATLEEGASSVAGFLMPGQVKRVTLRAKNTGTSTWSASTAHRLAAASDNTARFSGFPQCGGYSNSNSDARVYLCGDVSPNASHDFQVDVRLPTSGSSAKLSARMVQDGVAFFGETQPWTIRMGSAFCGTACTQCILDARTDLLPFYQSNGWDTSCSNRDNIVDNWCSGLDPSSCNALKTGQCSSFCNACRCSGGKHVDGTTIDANATFCGYQVCGMDNTVYECGSSGWSGLGSSCQ